MTESLEAKTTQDQFMVETCNNDLPLAVKLSNDDPDEIDDKSFEEIQELYIQLQDLFKKKSLELEKTFEEEKAQRMTLAYYLRRNQALLNILLTQADEQDHYISTKDQNQRINKIVQTVPRLSNKLKPLLSESIDTSSLNPNYLINLYLSEKIPELINDDLIQLELNPQGTDAWCRRNYPNLINAHNKPITIDQLNQLNHEQYTGVEFDLGIDGKLVLSPMATSSTSKKRRRK
ncbi:hypothetical protein KGF56_001181 [Candida oxycetoniae]|uniref:Uncharacterized protein n=1 Tax=Candida oxycetoniae TaxID=497107 RepID=A0AAI9WZ35_9ASCO|nr:uncharacterized protein KGF56_001181 [Candida oxycetoniae]KAI3405962.1 hypothetical protein KGF56_001181 [Candida oxycetoniae]